MASNNSKPFQSAWIEALGFRTPDTLLTTDPEAVLAFWKLHDRVIYKSVSGIRSIVTRLEKAHLARMHNIASCPTQFQQYIEGTDHRVHVVGEEVFACAIVADADDYRYAAGPIDMQPCQLPEDVSARCLRIAAAMELTLAGLDLRRTTEGDWYCFEVNPSPAFTFFEGKAGQPIAKAVAALLDRGKIVS
jgi:glutathione synthase/RimK-type ligase-like ATP-grasp enzyme